MFDALNFFVSDTPPRRSPPDYDPLYICGPYERYLQTVALTRPAYESSIVFQPSLRSLLP